MKTLGARMIRAAKCDGSLYDEIKTDRYAPAQASIVVVLSAVAAGVGIVLQTGIGDFFLKTLQTMMEWYIWALATAVVGTRVLQEPKTRTDVGTVIRLISFATAPGVIRLLGAIPGLGSTVGGFIIGVASIWTLGAMVVAVRKTLNYTTSTRAVGACVIGWTAQYFVMGILVSLRDPVSGT